MSSQTKIDEVKYWLDSKTALYWIYNNGEWKNFVQHRVNEILKRTRKEDWGHVAGVDNPADLGSRGVTASHLRDSKIWWEGPEWLKKGRENWPNSFPLEISDDVREESKKTAAVMTVTKEKSGVHSVIEIERYSSLRKLLRVTAYVKRFIENMKRKRVGVEMKVGRIEVDEIRQAEMIWIKNVQETLVDSPIYRKVSEQLGIVSQDGILVCKGRLENSDLGISGKFPIILPRDNKFTEMIILDCHEKVYHCKVRGTLAEVRSRFWITRGRQYVKKVLKHCFVCRKLEESLTPSHLMFGHRLTPLSFDVETPVDVDSSDKLCKRFLYLSRKLTHFWNRWRREYLTDLREQHKLKNFAPNKIAEGDVIQVHDENTKRGQWKIGIVEKLIFGKDGQVRGASVRLVGKGTVSCKL